MYSTFDALSTETEIDKTLITKLDVILQYDTTQLTEPIQTLGTNELHTANRA